MSSDRLRAMFDLMVVRKDSSAISEFYDPDFEMTSNGITQNYAEFHASHQGVYDTAITYAVEYDEDTWVEADDRVAVRVWITTQRPDEAATRIEVMLIATFRDGRIHRLWELTWPNWADLAAFEDYSSPE